nr:DUF6314 family protein [Halovulum dunhuangense]
MWDFAGDWRLSRRIDDRRAGTAATFEGRAVFAPDGDGLAYVETGTLHLPGQPPLEGSRRYQWRPGIHVHFEDGRFFHAIPPQDLRPEASHDCAPDLYHVSYDFSDWPVWRAEWRVQGPRKDYTLVSDYTPER